MDKQADLRDLLGDLGTKVQEGAAGAGNKIDSFLSGMSDNQKDVLRNSLIGGTAGAAGGGILGGDLSSAVLAGLLGAGAGAGGTAGYQMLTGREKLQGEVPTINSLPEQLVESGMREALSHPGVAAGLGVGGIAAAKNYPTAAAYERALQDFVKANKGNPEVEQAVAEASKRMRELQRGPGMFSRLRDAVSGNNPLQNKADSIGNVFREGTKSQQASRILQDLGTGIKPKGMGRAVGLPIAGRLVLGYHVDKYFQGDYWWATA
jgi:hypothetical protein